METYREASKLAPDPGVRQALGTFSRQIVVESGYTHRRAANCAFSVALHAAILTALIVLPFLCLRELRPYTFTEAAIITTVPPPVGQPGPSIGVSAMIPKKILPRVRLFAPVWSRGEKVAGPPGAPPSLKTTSPGVSSGIESPIFASLEQAPLLVAPDPGPDTETFRLGGDFRRPRVVYGVSLGYPEVAKQFRLMGKVILQGIVDQQGRVKHVRRVSGPVLLADAAARAVLRERFAPAMLNGEPTTCELVVVVTFRLF